MALHHGLPYLRQTLDSYVTPLRVSSNLPSQLEVLSTSYRPEIHPTPCNAHCMHCTSDAVQLRQVCSPHTRHTLLLWACESSTVVLQHVPVIKFLQSTKPLTSCSFWCTIADYVNTDNLNLVQALVLMASIWYTALIVG